MLPSEKLLFLGGDDCANECSKFDCIGHKMVRLFRSKSGDDMSLAMLGGRIYGGANE